ncbi:hypothetical protein [Xanthomonas fragariae]|uniref:hypothetical protein n=1 Tax=Xanthomonas fragariae TaxID=48664 RepID=UPI001EE030E0|nr:hypothetical protein [Xanthomonas fragariae]
MQQMQVPQSVAIIQNARQAVVPALHDVLRDSRKVDARDLAISQDSQRGIGADIEETSRKSKP